MTMTARNAHRRQRARALGICAECNDSPRDMRDDGTAFAKCRDCRAIDRLRSADRWITDKAAGRMRWTS